MNERTYRIDKKKEWKTITITALVMLIVFTLFYFIVMIALGFAKKQPLISEGIMVLLFIFGYTSLLAIIIQNSRKDQQSWCLQVLDDDHFILTNTRNEPTSYSLTDLARIDVRDDDTLFFYVKTPRKKVFIHNNLENFDEIKAYFQAMKARLKATAPTA